jgi:predicted dithiol-disulfide oxidoreductase (DUF899 family)
MGWSIGADLQARRQGSKVFETYWTTSRGVEVMDNRYRLLDLSVYGWQETWEDSPTGWPQRFEGKQAIPTNGRPIDEAAKALKLWVRRKPGNRKGRGKGPHL